MAPPPCKIAHAMAQIEFKQWDSRRGAFGIEVTRDGLFVGHIGKHLDTGAFRYWRGRTALLGTPVYEDHNLEALKLMILADP